MVHLFLYIPFPNTSDSSIFICCYLCALVYLSFTLRLTSLGLLSLENHEICWPALVFLRLVWRIVLLCDDSKDIWREKNQHNYFILASVNLLYSSNGSSSSISSFFSSFVTKPNRGFHHLPTMQQAFSMIPEQLLITLFPLVSPRPDFRHYQSCMTY